MLNKVLLRDLDVKGKQVIMRVDFNVPIQEGKVADDTRIRAALPSIQYTLEHGASLVLMSHMGRPAEKGFEEEFSLKPAAARLSELLGHDVQMAPDCRGLEVKKMADALQPGQILLLENTRFYAAEQGKVKTDGLSAEDAAAQKAAMKKAQQEMAQELATLGDIYVNDAFGTAHRKHASTAVIAQFMPVAAAGFLMEKELDYLSRVVENPAHPFVAIVGGKKIQGKLEVLKTLLQKVDVLIIGGGMAYTFKKVQGLNIGDSIYEEDLLEVAKGILSEAKERNVTLLLPIDNIIADDFSNDAHTQVIDSDIPDGWMGLDIGPASQKCFSASIASAKMIFWNGPMGCFEMPSFAKGTMAICQAVADSNAESIVGGGDSVSAVNQSGLATKFSHISTGGGASLKLIEGAPLAGVEALTDQD